jgi:hypothetical protein
MAGPALANIGQNISKYFKIKKSYTKHFREVLNCFEQQHPFHSRLASPCTKGFEYVESGTDYLRLMKCAAAEQPKTS